MTRRNDVVREYNLAPGARRRLPGAYSVGLYGGGFPWVWVYPSAGARFQLRQGQCIATPYTVEIENPAPIPVDFAFSLDAPITLGAYAATPDQVARMTWRAGFDHARGVTDFHGTAFPADLSDRVDVLVYHQLRGATALTIEASAQWFDVHVSQATEIETDAQEAAARAAMDPLFFFADKPFQVDHNLHHSRNYGYPRGLLKTTVAVRTIPAATPAHMTRVKAGTVFCHSGTRVYAIPDSGSVLGSPVRWSIAVQDLGAIE